MKKFLRVLSIVTIVTSLFLSSAAFAGDGDGGGSVGTRSIEPTEVESTQP